MLTLGAYFKGIKNLYFYFVKLEYTEPWKSIWSLKI